MIVEILVGEDPKLEIEGYKKLVVKKGYLLYNPTEKKVEVLVKKHPDGKCSVFTDRVDVIEKLVESVEVVDVHPH